jgi:hypothetical protein
MDINKLESQVVERAASEAASTQMRELTEFQLAFVSGGVGEISPY